MKTLNSFRPLLSYKYFIFDCDGVLWHGSKELYNSFNIIRLLQSQTKDYFLLTNDSTKTQFDGVSFIKRIANFSLNPRRFFSTAVLAADYAKARNYKDMYIVGGRAIFEEIGFALPESQLLGKDDSGKMDLDDKFFKRMHSEDTVDAVFVGKDVELNYYKLSSAICSVNKGADLVACHKNLMYRKNGIMVPNSGTTVRAIEAATGKKAFDLGKPGNYGIKAICRSFQINLEKEKDKMLLIGDNIGVEIMLANSLGIDSLLVLSGNTTEKNLEENLKKNEGIVPTYILPCLTHEL